MSNPLAVSRPILRTALVAALLALAQSATAQLYECPIGVPSYPEGRWAGPYGFASVMGSTGENLQEIAHAAVLPPAPGLEDKMRVLLWCRPTPDEPENLLPARTFLPDGDLLIFGGLNFLSQNDNCNSVPCIAGGMPCTNQYIAPYGHRATYRLHTDVDPPVWDSTATSMLRERWYPTGIAMQDGRVLVTGHGDEAEPSLGCPPADPWSDTYSTFDTNAVREYFEDGAIPFADTERHQQIDMAGCSAELEHEHGDYPRLHLLSSGWLLHSNDHDEGMWPIPPVPRTSIMNVRVPACGTAPTQRWERIGDPAHDRHGGSSVHFVYRNGPFFEPEDVVYAIGGIEYFGDAQCISPPNPSVASVQRMVNPLPGAVWQDAPDLPSLGAPGEGRGSHNSVILLDGSILVVGGATYLPGMQCAGQPPRAPLRYYPPEVFRDIAYGSPEDAWHVLPAQEIPRKYHSVAFVLPDGRVVSAGGEASPGAPASKHSLEIYEPDYYFDVNRPVITDAPATMELGGDPEDNVLSTTLCPLREVGRVVLIRNGSVTHAFDSHQRYVELEWIVQSSALPEVTLLLTPPELEGFTAQPGWYLLVVIDEEDIPSEGRWTRLIPSTQ